MDVLGAGFKTELLDDLTVVAVTMLLRAIRILLSDNALVSGLLVL